VTASRFVSEPQLSLLACLDVDTVCLPGNSVAIPAVPFILSSNPGYPIIHPGCCHRDPYSHTGLTTKFFATLAAQFPENLNPILTMRGGCNNACVDPTSAFGSCSSGCFATYR